MKVKDQKALAKFIIEDLKQSGMLSVIGKSGFMELGSCRERDLENSLYCAIASWNAKEIDKMFKNTKIQMWNLRKEYIDRIPETNYDLGTSNCPKCGNSIEKVKADRWAICRCKECGYVYKVKIA